MTTAAPFWTAPRLFAMVTVLAVTMLFIAANAHLIAVSFASEPDCVLQPSTGESAVLRAAKPSC